MRQLRVRRTRPPVRTPHGAEPVACPWGSRTQLRPRRETALVPRSPSQPPGGGPGASPRRGSSGPFCAGARAPCGRPGRGALLMTSEAEPEASVLSVGTLPACPPHGPRGAGGPAQTPRLRKRGGNDAQPPELILSFARLSCAGPRDATGWTLVCCEDSDGDAAGVPGTPPGTARRPVTDARAQGPHPTEPGPRAPPARPPHACGRPAQGDSLPEGKPRWEGH